MTERRRPPGRGAWLRAVERFAPPDALPLARKIAGTPGQGTFRLEHLAAGEDLQLAALLDRQLVHIYPDGGVDRRAGRRTRRDHSTTTGVDHLARSA